MAYVSYNDSMQIMYSKCIEFVRLIAVYIVS